MGPLLDELLWPHYAAISMYVAESRLANDFVGAYAE
jgi:hypothetical protein